MARNKAVWSSLNQWSEAELFAAYLTLATENVPDAAAMKMIWDHLGGVSDIRGQVQDIVSQVKRFAMTNSRG